MPEPDGIICSETNTDLKNKKAVGEFSEKTLADLIKNSTVSPTVDLAANTSNTFKHSIYSENLGVEWALLSDETYVFANNIIINRKTLEVIDCISIETNIGTMALVNVCKIKYSDNSYRIVTNLITKEKVRKHHESD